MLDVARTFLNWCNKNIIVTKLNQVRPKNKIYIIHWDNISDPLNSSQLAKIKKEHSR